VILGGGVAICLFTFVSTSHAHLCDRPAFLFILKNAFKCIIYLFCKERTFSVNGPQFYILLLIVLL